MEIERKWMVDRWPDDASGLTLLDEQYMRQGYISVHPTVRIREEAEKTVLSNISSLKSSGTLSRGDRISHLKGTVRPA